MSLLARNRSSLAAMAAATAAWGASGVLLARLAVNGASAASIVSLTAGVVLTTVGVSRGHSVRAALGQLGWWLPVLGLAEAANASLYYAALHLAPVSVVIALHLASPVLLLCVQLARGVRRLSGREALSLVALAAAIAVIGLGSHGGDGGSHPLLGALLALGSAASLACLTTVVGSVGRRAPSALGGGLQGLVAGALVAPALLLSPPAAGAAAATVAIAVLLFAPAMFLSWRALRHIEPLTASTIQLGEPVAAAVVGLAVFATAPSVADVVTVVLVLAAAWLDLSRPVPIEAVPVSVAA